MASREGHQAAVGLYLHTADHKPQTTALLDYSTTR